MKEFATKRVIQAAEFVVGIIDDGTAAIATGELAHCLKRRVFYKTYLLCSSPGLSWRHR